MKYPKEVGIVGFKDGTFDCYPNCVGIPPSVDYIQKDIAQSLADALEGLYSAVTDIRGIDMNTYAETELTQARAALANYRKGE